MTIPLWLSFRLYKRDGALAPLLRVHTDCSLSSNASANGRKAAVKDNLKASTTDTTGRWTHSRTKWIYPTVEILLVTCFFYRPPLTAGERTFSERASSRVARAVSVLLESVCSDLTLSFRFPSCLSLSLSCSCRFSIWHRKIEFKCNILKGGGAQIQFNGTSVGACSVLWLWSRYFAKTTTLNLFGHI